MVTALFTAILGVAQPLPQNRPAVLPTVSARAQIAQASTDSKIDYNERAKKGRFSFDFSKAEIEDIVKAISDMTRRNFIIPDSLKSKKITILSPTKISADEAYQVFLAALAANDITVVRSGKFYKLVPSKEAIKDTIPTCIGPEDTCPKFSEQMVTELIRLRYVDVNAINTVIKGLASKGSEVTIFQPTNALIVSEYASNLQRIKRIVDALDQPGFDDELNIVQIEHATAGEIADKVSQVFEIQPKGAATNTRGAGRSNRGRQPGAEQASEGNSGEEAEVRISKIIPDDRTNQLIIKANRRSFAPIKSLISKLDVPVAGNEGVHVYYLENADAEQLASTLGSLATGQQARRPAPRAQNRNQQPPAGEAQAAASLFSGEVKVTADKSTNSLIIMATRADFSAMRKLIEQLDVPRRQVYIEAAILEVKVDDDDTWGLDYHVPFSDSGAFSSASGGQRALGYAQGPTAGLSGTLIDLSNPAALLAAAGGSLVGVLGEPVTVGTGQGQITIPSFGVILKWLEESTSANVLSTPHILTSDNEEATIEVGEKIPFRRGTSFPTIPGTTGSNINLNQFTNLFSQVDRIDVSLKLTITPHVNERNKIRLEIDQQIEDVTAITELGVQTATRSAKTVVVIDDQQTVVLGGLMTDRTTETETKIPILGDIPLIGWLFKDVVQRMDKLNLMLVLTPYIVHDKEDFQRIFERKMNEYEEFAATYYGNLPEFRRHINYARKTGPLGKLTGTIRRELDKIENGGAGSKTGEKLISPNPPSEGESIVVPRDLEGEGHLNIESDPVPGDVVPQQDTPEGTPPPNIAPPPESEPPPQAIEPPHFGDGGGFEPEPPPEVEE